MIQFDADTIKETLKATVASKIPGSQKKIAISPICKQRLLAFQSWALNSDALCIPTPTSGFTTQLMKTYMHHSKKVESHHKGQATKQLELLFPNIKDAEHYMIFNEEARQVLGNWRSPYIYNSMITN